MIIDKSNGRLEEIRAFAKERGLSAQLQDKLAQLDGGTCYGKPSDVVVYPDFAPYSMAFCVVPKGNHLDVPLEPDDVLMNGGFIYHGRGDTGAEGPTFSVRIGDTAEGWSVHT